MSATGEEEDEEEENFDVETAAERHRRHMDDPMEEVSDPDYWARLHRGTGSSSSSTKVAATLD